MTSLVDKATRLATTIDQRKEREARAKEIRKLTSSLTRTNERMHTALREHAFLALVDEAAQLAEVHAEVMDRYRDLRDEMVSLWGDNPERIEILDTADIIAALEILERDLQSHSEQVKRILNAIFAQISGDNQLARTISQVIPDLGIDLTRIRTAYEFFSQHGAGSYMKFQAWVKEPGDLSGRAGQWKEHLNRIRQEHEKMDVNAIETISEATRDLLRHLLTHRRYPFDQLSSGSIEEIRSVFPELSKRLVVKVGES